jgi:hypothetical protein
LTYPTIISDGELADFDIYCVTVETTQDTLTLTRARGGSRVMTPSPMTLDRVIYKTDRTSCIKSRDEKLEGQRYADVNVQWLARLTVDQEIEAAEFNADLLADDADVEAVAGDVPFEVI